MFWCTNVKKTTSRFFLRTSPEYVSCFFMLINRRSNNWWTWAAASFQQLVHKRSVMATARALARNDAAAAAAVVSVLQTAACSSRSPTIILNRHVRNVPKSHTHLFLAWFLHSDLHTLLQKIDKWGSRRVKSSWDKEELSETTRGKSSH